jgi:iron-sulfur cluster assembly protein
MFKLTAAAALQIIKAARQGGTEGMPLRLAAARNPDGSIDYRIGFDELTDDDIRMTCEGIEVIMAPEQLLLLDETTVDFVELEPGQFHFIFLNPKDPTYRPPHQDA